MQRHVEVPPDKWRRDRGHRVKFLGLIVPGILVLWAAVNLLTCQAIWPHLQGRRLSFTSVTDWFRVTMAASVKLGIAVACFGWYFMANRDDWVYWSLLVTFVGCGIAVAAFVLGSLAFIW